MIRVAHGDPNEVIRMAESYLQTQIGVCVDAVEKCRGRVTVGLRLTKLGDINTNYVLRAATLWWDNDEQVVKVLVKSLSESTPIAGDLMVALRQALGLPPGGMDI